MSRACFFFFVFFAFSSCAPSGPVDPVWGKEACAHCHMLLSDKASAAQLLPDDGERRFYDDAGCLAADLADGAQGRAWVHAAAEEEEGEVAWLDAATARFAPGRTPMDFGFVASSTGTASFADVQAVVHARRTKVTP